MPDLRNKNIIDKDRYRYRIAIEGDLLIPSAMDLLNLSLTCSYGSLPVLPPRSCGWGAQCCPPQWTSWISLSPPCSPGRGTAPKSSSNLYNMSKASQFSTSVLDPYPDWIRILLGQRTWIRIRSADPDPGRSKLAPKKGKNAEISCLKSMNVLCVGLWRTAVFDIKKRQIINLLQISS